jgi:transcriptional regulator GlxA family with amidase domain
MFTLEVAATAEVFAEVGRLVGNPAAYKVHIVSLRPGVVEGLGGMRVMTDRTIGDILEPLDTLLITGNLDSNPDVGLISWLSQHAASIRRVASAGSSACMLTAAGLLDGRQAAPRLPLRSQFLDRYLDHDPDTDSLLVHDGSIFTSTGHTAGVDLALALVEDDFGRELAVAVARNMMMIPHRPGMQFGLGAIDPGQAQARDVIQEVREYIVGNLSADLSIEALAARVHMSTRNFSRVFRRDTNMTPGDFVEMTRLQAACRMLVNSRAPAFKIVAYGCGFKTVSNMRRAFLRNLGIGPSEYRKRFEPPQSDRRFTVRPLTLRPDDRNIVPRVPSPIRHEPMVA